MRTEIAPNLNLNQYAQHFPSLNSDFFFFFFECTTRWVSLSLSCRMQGTLHY